MVGFQVIITRTPMRISYVGGGSDYEGHFMSDFGSVTGTTINQYIYVFSNELSEVANEKIRFTYRQTESVDAISDLQHPVLRSVLQDLGWDTKLNIGTFSELPAGVGLGGSSAFTVGLLNLLLNIKGEDSGPESLAKRAVKIERTILEESGGLQDQYHAAYGGFRNYRFDRSGVSISSIILPPESIDLLNKQQILVWVGESRISSNYAEETKKHADSGDSTEIYESAQLSEKLFHDLRSVTNPKSHFDLIADAVNYGWNLKKKYTANQSESVEEIIHIGFANGASAAKLCGAGGSGFVLILFDEQHSHRIKSALSEYKVVIPRIVSSGSKVIFRDLDEY